MSLRILFCQLLLLAGVSHASVTFDGHKIPIAPDEWQVLEADRPPPPSTLAENLDTYIWKSVTRRDDLGGKQGKVLRLDIRVTYEGPQKPILLLPYIFVPNITIGVLSEGNVLIWHSLEEFTLDSRGRETAQTTGIVRLPIDRPGDYQVIIQSASVFSNMILRGGHLHLDQDYLVHEYPDRIANAAGFLGAILTYILCCLVVMVYRIRIDMFYGICFLVGSFFSIYIQSGVIFLDFNLDVKWWVIYILPLVIALANTGVFLYVSVDLRKSGSGWGRYLLNACAAITLVIALLNIPFPFREYQLLGYVGFFFLIVGLITALVMLAARALTRTLRDKLYGLVIGVYFFIVLYGCWAVFATITVNYPIQLQYVAANLVGIFILLEYLITSARQYLEEKTRQSANVTRMEMVNRFSHELRTPLNAVIGLAELMKSNNCSEKVDKYADMIHSAGNTLLDLVNDILDFSKLGATGIRLVEQPIRLDKLFLEIHSGFVPKILERHIPIVLDIKPDVPFFLLGDGLRLKQIFINLLNNAIKFSPSESQIFISIDKGKRIDDRVELLCAVSDHGRGIPEETLDSIFEPYVQAMAEDGAHLRGTGLGLAICKSLIEQLGGSIHVDSRVGEGTTFYFNIWIKLDPEAPDLKHCLAPLRGKRYLVVSKYLTINKIFLPFLEHWGGEVSLVSTCEQAPALTYDMVIIGDLFNEAMSEEWINQQPESTIINILQLKAGSWVASLTHPNVHSLLIPSPLLTILSTFVEQFTGESIALSGDEEKKIELGESKHQVLLIDDNKVNLMVAGKLLEAIGVSHATAQGGMAGLEMLCSGKKFSVVLLDCEMPDISGFEVCRRWRKYEATHHLQRTPVIALTAHALTEVSDECLIAGMDETLFKPISKDAIVDMLNRYPGIDAIPDNNFCSIRALRAPSAD